MKRASFIALGTKHATFCAVETEQLENRAGDQNGCTAFRTRPGDETGIQSDADDCAGLVDGHLSQTASAICVTDSG